ncbi:MAG: hypothetical protein AB7U97_16900 [Pirellulales bacterium]
MNVLRIGREPCLAAALISGGQLSAPTAARTPTSAARDREPALHESQEEACYRQAAAQAAQQFNRLLCERCHPCDGSCAGSVHHPSLDIKQRQSRRKYKNPANKWCTSRGAAFHLATIEAHRCCDDPLVKSQADALPHSLDAE